MHLAPHLDALHAAVRTLAVATLPWRSVSLRIVMGTNIVLEVLIYARPGRITGAKQGADPVHGALHLRQPAHHGHCLWH